MESFGEASSKENCFLYLEKENLLYNQFGHQVLLWWQKRTTYRRISVTMNKNLVKSDVVKHELRDERL